MAKFDRYDLHPDKKGMIWDLLMYVPTVGGLATGAAVMWFKANENLTYLLLFLACFFLFQSINRIMGRLLLLPGNPQALEVSKQRVVLELKNHSKIELVKNVRYFSDYAGKSFGLSGLDLSGAKKQYVFHKGQFADQGDFNKIGGQLKIFA